MALHEAKGPFRTATAIRRELRYSNNIANTKNRLQGLVLTRILHHISAILQNVHGILRNPDALGLVCILLLFWLSFAIGCGARDMRTLC